MPVLYSSSVGRDIDLASQRASQLRQKLEHHNYQYHVLDDPVISDEEYDRMFRELVVLEEEYPQLAVSDSPTQRVGGEPQERFQKVEHHAPMLSLGNAFNGEELWAFHKRISKLLETDKIEFATELKIDGVAVALTSDWVSLYPRCRWRSLLRHGLVSGFPTVDDARLCLASMLTQETQRYSHQQRSSQSHQGRAGNGDPGRLRQQRVDHCGSLP